MKLKFVDVWTITFRLIWVRKENFAPLFPFQGRNLFIRTMYFPKLTRYSIFAVRMEHGYVPNTHEIKINHSFGNYNDFWPTKSYIPRVLRSAIVSSFILHHFSSQCNKIQWKNEARSLWASFNVEIISNMLNQ